MKTGSLPAFVRRRGLSIRHSGIAALALILPCGLAACSSSVDRRADAWGGEGAVTGAARQPVASQAGSWELVFQSPRVSAELAGLEPGPEFFRRDSSLSPRGNEPVTAMSNWPEAPRADLARRRSVRVRDTASSFIYFFPTGDGRGSSAGSSSRRSGLWY
jgi:hypothetical protein